MVVFFLENKEVFMANLSSLQGVLQNYVVSSPDIQGAAVVTPDGLPLAAVLPNSMDEERTAAMSAAMLSLGERIGRELARGAIERVFVQGDTGYGILTSCGDEAMLLTLASKDAKQGMLFLEIKQMTEKVMAAMGSSAALNLA
ncbi:MAG TPA: roadblock/LC7 domain-containing protein [Stenomitos sp.]